MRRREAAIEACKALVASMDSPWTARSFGNDARAVGLTSVHEWAIDQAIEMAKGDSNLMVNLYSNLCSDGDLLGAYVVYRKLKAMDRRYQGWSLVVACAKQGAIATAVTYLKELTEPKQDESFRQEWAFSAIRHLLPDSVIYELR